MSLKAFHVVFIVVATVFLAGFGAWGFHDFSQSGNVVNLGMAIGSCVSCLVLIVYSRWFVRKLKHVSYL